MNAVIQLTGRQRAELFQATAQKLGIADVIVEKDFWVCWTLSQLFTLPDVRDHLIFKGGTSLSKVWKIIDRFSEDIDVSLGRDWLGFSGASDPENIAGRNKQGAQIEKLRNACESKVAGTLLPALTSRAADQLAGSGWKFVIEEEDAQTVRFRYPTALPEAAPYIRREVKIEFGARSDSWPKETASIIPYAAEAFPFEDATVAVQVLAAERTFWEKATILHAEAHRAEGSDVPARYSRHYADLAAFQVSNRAAAAIAADDLRARVVEHKQVFFPATWARYPEAVPGTFRLVPDDTRIEELRVDYGEMQLMYFREPTPWPEIIARLRELESLINRRV
ncbi:MAG: nucleotidyl transferase AbiEii/AbiGii toxin family protein [Opitutus sp.]|nr:nucleotidyl transferase AbiEii/AbiGii toxin family protein [Opitutus sp.]